MSSNVRLNANRMLRTRKILSYVAERLEPPPGQSHGTEMRVEDYLELYCQNQVCRSFLSHRQLLTFFHQLLDPKVTLGTVRAHIWKGGGDVLLQYNTKTTDAAPITA